MIKMNRKSDRLSRSVFAKDILHHLRMGIISNELPAHYRLVEGVLAQEYGVSRGPVRSALHVLEQQGLVRILPGGGAEVIGFTEKHALDLFEVRQTLEETAARMMMKLPELNTTMLRDIVAAMSSKGNAILQLGDLDMDFHYEYFKLADNWSLLQIWNTLSPVVADMLTLTNQLNTTDPQLIADNHSAILKAIEERDLDQLLYQIDSQLNIPKSLVMQRYAEMAKLPSQ